jgi:ribonuclease HI
MTDDKIVIYTDGGARGNPGPAAIGVVIRRNQQVIDKISRCIGSTTNNQAEYQAIYAGLVYAQALGAAEVEIFSDSELVTRQLAGHYRVKNHDLGEWYLKITNLSRNFRRLTYHSIPREKNTEADELVNKALDEQALG